MKAISENNKLSLITKLGVFSASLLVASSALYIYSPVVGSHADSKEADINLNITPGIGIGTSTANVNLNATVGSFVHNSVNVDVATNSQYGYTLTLEDKDSSSSMTATGISDVVTSDFSGKKTSSDMADNTWGFGLDATDYYKVPTNGNPVALKRTNTVMTTDYETTTVNFGAKVGMNLTAGTYSDVVVLTAYVNGQDEPEEEPTMQSFTCPLLENVGDSMELEDVRDGNVYTVKKLADGNCWMTENLRLIDKVLDSSTSDLPDGETYTVPVSTQNGFDAYDTSFAYLDDTYGGYYNFYTATAGWGTTEIDRGDTPKSICPKGWRLPSGDGGEYHTMVNYYNTPELIQDEPGFTLSGLMMSYGTMIFKGQRGYFWHGSAYAAKQGFYLYITNDSIGYAGGMEKLYGMPIRCIARY